MKVLSGALVLEVLMLFYYIEVIVLKRQSTLIRFKEEQLQREKDEKIIYNTNISPAGICFKCL
ncbi:hypothetical protein CWR48_04880 [Oceanobacillus arenosus]|uniref:Uncharacterized protein n=1 Tax=Oceanobacillus arenosus TaxID=1229153 RepID=A0A3D8PXL7_9BACI|nr:hypothetical protein CWR48_04880 [Oceanobacillus arenosus]